MESKGLEALKKIICHSLDEDYSFSRELENDAKIVEQELKEYESYKTFLDNVEKGLITYTPRDIWEEERKKFKALEIIKEKNVDCYALIDSDDLDMYNDRIQHTRLGDYLTQEEYDLLKEVLL